MQRRTGRVASLVLLVATACSPGDGVSQSTAVPTDTSASATSGTDGGPESDTGAPTSVATLPPATIEPADDHVDLPGLLDNTDEPIPNDPDVRTGALDNGLRYYVRHNERPGAKASLRLAIRAGSVNETGTHTGVAHFVEHMLFNGTEEYPENELIDVLRGFGAAFGADINAYTSFDETVYELEVPNDDDSVSTALNVLDQWLSHATFDPAQVEAERGVITDEWRSTTQTVDGRLFDIAEDLYLSGTPYADRDPIGTAESIGSVPHEELRRFYDDWYRPDNAAVVVVGDIDVDDVVDDIEEMFGDAVARTAEMPPRPDTTFDLEDEPGFALHSDPDQTTVDVEVDLPLPAFEGTGTAALRAEILDSMIFTTLIRRLDADISAGTAPFDEIVPGTNSFVASLDAPALYATTTADRVDATLQALLDEYERANRFGFTPDETEVAKASIQAEFDSLFDRRNTTQDVELAERYVAHFLTDDPYPTIDDLHALASETIDGITSAALDLRFRARWHNTAPHVIISTPESEAASMPTEAEVLAVIADVADRDLEPRASGRDLPDDLIEAPGPVEAGDRERLLDLGDPYFDPVAIEFPNGARVIATSNDIVAGQVGFQAASPGGSSLVADADVVDALYAADIVTSSGVGEYNQTELEQILADRDLSIVAEIGPYVDSFSGGAATADLETLFQLVHLYMTQPRVDPVALNQVQRFYGPVIADPSSNPDLAGFDALLDARYPGELRYAVLPTADEFATLDLDGVRRVWQQRFGNAGDWVFVFAGDVDLDELFDLAERYIGTLPGDAQREQWVDVAADPPADVTRVDIAAGTGDTATLSLLFTTSAGAVDGELRATTDVVTQLLTARLTDVIRERLGESYSPYAFTTISSDPDPVIETYVQVTGSPDRIVSVADLVVAELADLATNGPTEREFRGAFAQVEEAYGFVDNGTFMTEIVNDAIWPDRELQDYLDQYAELGDVTAGSVQQYIAEHVPADRYIQVAVLPR